MTQTYEQLIHKPDGSLVSSNPYIVIGTRLKVVKDDEDWGSQWIGAQGVITEQTAKHNKDERYRREDGKPDHVWAEWKNPQDPSKDITEDWFHPDSVEVV